MTTTRKVGLIVGLLFLMTAFVIPPPVGMSQLAWYTSGIALLLAA